MWARPILSGFMAQAFLGVWLSICASRQGLHLLALTRLAIVFFNNMACRQ